MSRHQASAGAQDLAVFIPNSRLQSGRSHSTPHLLDGLARTKVFTFVLALVLLI